MVCSCHPAGLCGGDDLCGVQRRGTAVASPRSGVLSSSTVELNREIGVQWIKYKLPQAVEFANSLGLLIGDAVHNLHTALDYAWIWALLTRGDGIGKRSKFPFRQTSEELKAALAGIEIKSTDPLFDLLITGIKPYPAGNDLLCLLHGLDITDKHHLLMPLVQVAEVNGIATEDSAGVLMITGTTPIQGENPFYVGPGDACKTGRFR
jgi:hypothetical protein